MGKILIVDPGESATDRAIKALLIGGADPNKLPPLQVRLNPEFDFEAKLEMKGLEDESHLEEQRIIEAESRRQRRRLKRQHDASWQTHTMKLR